jgi:threonine aldolase
LNAPALRVDLVSDTATRPSPGMRQAIATAEVGDEQRGEDPTVNRLNQRVAHLLGKEAALFLPSGTMCNQIALAVHCRPGDEIICAANAHVRTSEGAGAAVFAGSVINPVPSPRGVFGTTELCSALGEGRIKSPRPRLVVIEQTSNRGGGSVWPLSTIREVAAAARERGLLVHMDGARLMNAAVASGVDARDFAEPVDSVWLDLSKGLGCPVGAVLAGSAAFIREADRWKHRFGGAMRQAGILAAAGLYALDHNVDRLAEDHRHARRFAAGLAHLRGIRLLNPEVETNLVFFDVEATGRSAAEIARRLSRRSIRIGIESAFVMRAVFHLDVTTSDVDVVLEALGEGVEDSRPAPGPA